MVEKLSDIAGIRIICSFTQDIYQIADMISRQEDVTVLYVKVTSSSLSPTATRATTWS